MVKKQGTFITPKFCRSRVWGIAQLGSLLRPYRSESGCQKGYTPFWRFWKRICFQAHSGGPNSVPCAYKELNFLYFPCAWVSHSPAGWNALQLLQAAYIPVIWPPSFLKPATKTLPHMKSFSHFQSLSSGKTWSLLRIYRIRSDLPRIISLFFSQPCHIM